MKKIIKEINPYFKSVAVLAIQMTDFCNFSCRYCITGKKFSGKSIKPDSFEKIKDLVIKLKQNYKYVEVVLTGGEPTLATDFFYFINQLLDLQVVVKINSNAYILNTKQDNLKQLSKNKNLKNLCFNLTFHYKQYLNKLDLFIDALKNLSNNHIDFGVNFLLPDDETLENYLQIEKEIFSKVDVKVYNYSLIKSTNGEISKNYSSEMLTYFDKNFKKEEKLKNIEITYDDGKKEVLSSSEILYHGLNIFSGYKCNYLNKDYLNIYLETDLTCYFGSCYTLNRLKYSMDELIQMLETRVEKNIVCGDHSCLCESDFNTAKSKMNNSGLIDERLKQIIKKIKPSEFDLSKTIIGNNSIQIIFSYNKKLIFVIVEKIVDKSINYPFSDGDLGYQYFVKNIDNEFIGLEKNEENLIMLFLKKIFLLKDILKRIIDNRNI